MDGTAIERRSHERRLAERRSPERRFSKKSMNILPEFSSNYTEDYNGNLSKTRRHSCMASRNATYG